MNAILGRSISSTSPIGLDIGTSGVKACQLSRRANGRVEVSGVVTLPRSPGESLVSVMARLSALLTRQGFRGRDVVVAAPMESQLLGMFEVPSSDSGAPLEKIIRAELARAHKQGIASFEFAWWALPSGERASEGTTVNAVGLAHDQATAMLDALEGAGFQGEAIDVTACALVRGCSAALLPEPAINAVLDFGYSRPFLVLMRGQRIVYQRELADCGLSRLQSKLRERLRLNEESAGVLLARLAQGESPTIDPELQTQLELALAEHASRLVRELEVSLRYAQHRYPGSGATRLVLVGGGAGVPGLVSDLRSGLGCEVLAPTLQELCPMGVSFAQAPAAGAFALALGLAMHRWETSQQGVAA